MSVPFQPLSENWDVKSVRDQTGKAWVMIQVHSPNGVHVSFMTTEIAQKIAGLIEKEAKQAATGLILPPGLN